MFKVTVRTKHGDDIREFKDKASADAWMLKKTSDETFGDKNSCSMSVIEVADVVPVKELTFDDFMMAYIDKENGKTKSMADFIKSYQDGKKK